MMALLVGLFLAVAVGAFATALRLDRDRAFYPTVMIVIAAYYVLFAWTVSVRLSVFLFFSAFVLLKLAPPVLMLFAIVDAAAAIWTRQCLKSSGVN